MTKAASGRGSRPLFSGGGEMGERMRAFDWSATPLGPARLWPASLRTTVQMMLKSRYQMWLGWGPELTFFCNDAYAPTLGLKKSWAIGAPASRVWSEVWDDVTPQIQRVLQDNEATFDEALLLFLQRSGYDEETYHTFSYIPVTDDEGAVAGLLCVVTEVTERVIGERRLESLHALSSRLVTVRSEEEFEQAAGDALRLSSSDLPFVLAYTFEANGEAHLAVGTFGDLALAPPVFSLDMQGAPWPARQIFDGGEPVTLDLPRSGAIPCGPWDTPPSQALVIPIRPHGQARPSGFLVAGINPYRRLDGDTRDFVQLIASQIGAGLATLATARERREAMQRERQLSQRYEAVVSHLPIGVGVIDTAGRFVVKNPRMADYVGDIIPTSDPAFANRWKGYGPDGALLTREQMPGLRSLRGESLNPGMELLHTLSDGREIWTRVLSVPLRDEQGAVTGVVFVVDDIDNLKRIEAELRDAKTRLEAALVGAEIGTWTWELPDGDVRADANIAALFDLSVEEARSAHVSLFIGRMHPDDQVGVEAEVGRAVEQGGPFSVECRVRRRDGDIWIVARGAVRPMEGSSNRMFAGAVFDITERKRAEERQTLLINELNHRVKNTLSVVQSMATQGARSAADDPQTFAALFGSRLRTLSRAHDVLTQTHWSGAGMSTVVAEALAPFALSAGERLKASGPQVMLSPSTAVILSMALHELATNAAKYGSLSTERGRVEVEWAIDGAILDIRWTESGGPLVVQPLRKGFGSRLVTDGLAHQLDATINLDFRPDGLNFHARLPIEKTTTRSTQ